MLTIDGSMGEGGGQVLRTALALSLVTRTPFRIERIRARRRRPGLMRQHLTAVEAAARVGESKVAGGEVGSLELVFEPHGVRAGDYAFSVGTAGSATLVLQTLLPALLTAKEPSRLVLEGGTHNPLAPPFDFLAKAFLPLLARMGARIEATLERPGFYPAGGGRFSVRIEPAAKLERLDLRERGELRGRLARAMVANLAASIGRRELAVVAKRLGWEEDRLRLEPISGSPGPGNVLLLELASENVTEVIAGFGERGVLAETVAERAVDEARRYLVAGVPVGVHLADQLMIPLALAGGGSFVTLPLSRHAQTQIEVIQKFLPVRIQVTDRAEGSVLVEVEGGKRCSSSQPGR